MVRIHGFKYGNRSPSLQEALQCEEASQVYLQGHAVETDEIYKGGEWTRFYSQLVGPPGPASIIFIPVSLWKSCAPTTNFPSSDAGSSSCVASLGWLRDWGVLQLKKAIAAPSIMWVPVTQAWALRSRVLLAAPHQPGQTPWLLQVVHNKVHHLRPGGSRMLVHSTSGECGTSTQETSSYLHPQYWMDAECMDGLCFLIRIGNLSARISAQKEWMFPPHKNV